MTDRRIYLLTEKTYKVLKKKGVDLTCAFCGEPLKVGDMVYSNRTRYHYKRYHLECYEKTFQEIKEK